MKKGLKMGLIIASMLILLVLMLFCLYRHFVTDQIMDGGDGMENPDAIQVLDGEYTYVDNDALWSVVEGPWESADDHWRMILSMDNGMTLSLDGETVLEGEIYFTYLQPGEILETRFYLDDYMLRISDQKALGEITYICHKTGDGGGTLWMDLELSDGTEETVKLQKIK